MQNDFYGITETQWQRWLQECRHRFGRAPRAFTPDVEQQLLINPPWITKLFFRNLLVKLIQNRTQLQLFQTGNVVWGHTVQANGDLFSPPTSDNPDDDDRPGEIVFTPDVRVSGSPQYLEEVASRLFALRELRNLDKELQPWADYLNAETTRVIGKPVPKRIATSMPCFVSTTLFRRNHLPGGVLTQPLFPVVVALAQPYFAMVLPAGYWPESLLNWWMNS